MQTIFDTAVLLLVLAKARNRGGSGIIAFIVKQGLMYYLCVHRLWLFIGQTNPRSNPKVELGNIRCLGAHAYLCSGSYFSSEIFIEWDESDGGFSRSEVNTSWEGASNLLYDIIHFKLTTVVNIQRPALGYVIHSSRVYYFAKVETWHTKFSFLLQARLRICEQTHAAPQGLQHGLWFAADHGAVQCEASKAK